ncbi:MAG: hypothetical protein ACD_73C00333G0004 [uncultured bacterium]|nr:MAG: hypothetical protein ACD_73C00333G0004 [uncultured bacterium]
MFPLWSKLIFVCSGILGLFFLIKSILRTVALYNNPNSVEFFTLLPSLTFEIKQIGMYEIAVKCPYWFAMLPTGIKFRLVNLKTNTEIPIVQKLNFFSQRRNMSGDRIFPISEFNVLETGNYQLQNFNTEKFKEKDKFLITPKTGLKGLLLILAIVFSGIFFIGGMVMAVLSFVIK